MSAHSTHSHRETQNIWGIEIFIYSQLVSDGSFFSNSYGCISTFPKNGNSSKTWPCHIEHWASNIYGMLIKSSFVKHLSRFDWIGGNNWNRFSVHFQNAFFIFIVRPMAFFRHLMSIVIFHFSFVSFFFRSCEIVTSFINSVVDHTRI